MRVVVRKFVPFAHGFCHLTCVRFFFLCVEPFGGCVACAGMFLSLLGVLLAKTIENSSFFCR